MSGPGAPCGVDHSKRKSDRLRVLLVFLLVALLGPVPALGEVLTPPYFNLAEGREIVATATCGDEGSELYCKLVGANAQNNDHINVIQGQVCDTCDLKDKSKAHPPEYAVDGLETWWQSPPLSRGMKFNEVNLTINLGQEFHVAYVFLRMGNSPRPGLWALEKSSDYGKTYTPWQYFSDSPSDCETHFGKDSLLPITEDNSVICNTEYSKIVPLEGGEIPISLLNNRPSSSTYFNSSVLQEWTRATNVRLRLLRTKTLLGHLMSVARQDPTVTRRYFYSIKDISIGGRCMCNGHAQTCDIPDPLDSNKLHCRCQHHTCGAQCERCCPGFEQKAWRQSQHWQKFICEPCNCFNHSNECEYDAKIDIQKLSLDIHGEYDGGGVCKNCMHNTMGINCNECKPKFYRPREKFWNETDVCKPCDCDNKYSTGNCAEETGLCECKIEYQSPYCDVCSYGYFGFPDCKPCTCNLNGTDGDYCEPISSKCPCKENYDGIFCDQCAEGYYNFPKCEACECQTPGSPMPTCDFVSGNCTCRNTYAGRTCDRCEAGFYNYPECKYCNCDVSGTIASVCNNITGECLCKEGFGGSRCDQCIPGYFSELRGGILACVQCNCSDIGSTSPNCDALGQCNCNYNFGGQQCNQCSPGYYKYPECLACNCDTHGAIGITCDSEGQCNCKENFFNPQCSICREGYYNFPLCEECNCDPNGVIQSFGGCESVPAGELCQCKDRVQGRICDQCRPLFWNLKKSNQLGCDECHCNRAGTQSGIGVCDTKTGQCSCKYSIGTRKCEMCKDGTYNLTQGNVFGCTDCDCDIGGSVNNVCNKETGNCLCKPRITGRRCDEPIDLHYFPTLHQYRYEVEDGTTTSDNIVRHAFSQKDFPDFSWRAYAVFSHLMNEVRQEVQIKKSSVYQMILRYVIPGLENVAGTILITPENPSETEQSFDFILKPTTKPSFATVSGLQGITPSPLVMNPGSWHVTIKSDKSLFLDYFVLIPAAYYEATILTKNVSTPCIVGNKDLCRHFGYPNISAFDTVRGNGGFASNNGDRIPIESFIDHKQLSELRESNIPLLNNGQRNLSLDMMLSKTGDHILLIEYITPSNDASGGGYVNVSTQGSVLKEHSKMYFDNCPYTTPCRQVFLDDQGRTQLFKFQENFIRLNIDIESGTSVGIKSVVAIPYEDWHLDYIKPQSICVRRNGTCIKSDFPIVPESKKVEFENEVKELPSLKPSNILDKSAEFVYLDSELPHIDLPLVVPESGQYVFIVQYYQPNYPESKMEILLHNGHPYEALLPIKHCPSTTGCRSVVQMIDGNKQFTLTENFVLTLKAAERNGVWLDYLLIMPAREYMDSLLNENRLDQTREFIGKCGSDYFSVNHTDEGFCRDAIFSLTSDYNNGALPCECDYSGSLSFDCNRFGGQCDCKENIIGRNCEACKTGYYGFPECKPCNCPSTAVCEKTTGECICPPRVTGEKCDQCEKYTYGFDIVVGCEDCNCSPMGVIDDELQCDLFNGSCSCKDNIIGRACDQCAAGHFSFPNCDPCDCNIKGSKPEICDQTNAECSCKDNVIGFGCESCNDGTFNLHEDNEAGCTKCFCFGKTERCNSANLYWTQISTLAGWKMAVTPADNFTIETIEYTPEITSRAITADFDLIVKSQTAYFEASEEYLGNKLSSYGGNLNYTIYYTTGSFGNAVSKGDVILYGADIYLIHSSLEQPASSSYWTKSLPLIESEFSTVHNLPVSREVMMTVLVNLKGIYIRATYWDPTVMTKLQHISLDYGVEIWNKESEPANTVEKCDCPESYKGNSCEECAEGFYRISTGPHGGFCVPCQCNGHATSCDVNTGICIDCQHDTTGDHCDKCVVGYHGDATQKTHNDCIICACPVPVKSNNFADACELSPDGDQISCECQDNYIGAQCESCAPGFYGRPRQIDDYCKPCKCSGNINTNDPSSCDSVTGECLKCMNNSFGAACNLCRPGYYGDAVTLKDCQACMCDPRGMERCDSYTGICICKPGVIGEKCDRCEVDHWGFESGQGCTPCDCSVASNSKQCDDNNGQCKCKSGVNGKQCEKCAPGFWDFSDKGCTKCGCKGGYSLGFGCNAETGQCECLPGVVGDRCDRCPYRNVLIKDKGCFPCDSCVHDLLNSTDDLERWIDPVIGDFKNKTSGYFTAQRLVYINDNKDHLETAVNKLNPNVKDMELISNTIEAMKQKKQKLERTAEYSIKDAERFNKNAIKILKKSEDAYDNINLERQKANAAVKQIEQLAKNFELGDGLKMDIALEDAKQILSDISAKNLSAALGLSVEHMDNATNLLENIKDFIKPIAEHQKMYEGEKIRLKSLKDLISDLLSIKKEIDSINDKAEEYNQKNSVDDIESKLKNLDLEEKTSLGHLKQASEYLKNTSRILDMLKNATETFKADANDRFILNNHVEKKLKEIGIDNLEYQKTREHKNELLDKVEELQAILDSRNRDNHTDKAVTAASAYSNIVSEINKADEDSKLADIDFNQSLELGNDLESQIESRLRDSYEQKNLAEQLRDEASKKDNNEEIIESFKTDHEQLINQANKSIDAAIKAKQRFTGDSNDYENKINNINTNNDVAQDSIKKAESIIDKYDTSKMLNSTKDISKSSDTIVKNKKQIDNSLQVIDSSMPHIKSRESNLDQLQKEHRIKASDLENLAEDLEKSLAAAKDIANSIKVGVNFNESVYLQLPIVDDVEMLTTTRVSAYFRTKQQNGFLLYLGNIEGTNLERTRKDDYMALEVKGGKPLLRFNIGYETETLVSPKFVSNDNWHQIIVERIGKDVKMTLREELPDKTIDTSVVNLTLKGNDTIFHLDRDRSKLYVGGYPQSKIQDDLEFNTFDGKIESLVIGDTPVGLWNFINSSGLNNVEGAARDKLLESQTESVFRFQGDGYVIMDGGSYKLTDSANIELRFKTLAREGLIFLVGKEEDFMSIEIRDGHVALKLGLGGAWINITTPNTFNDGQWHVVKAKRYLKTAVLNVDENDIDQKDVDGPQKTLHVSEYMYFGGYPSEHEYVEITEKGFDGCLEVISISGKNIDLNENVQEFGIKHGCPSEFRTLVNMNAKDGGFIESKNLSVSNDFNLVVRFKTTASEGLIFYATNKDQSQGISLSLVNGHLVVKIHNEELSSRQIPYNDNRWHVANTIFDKSSFKLIVDDYDVYGFDSLPSPLYIMYGNLYIGGLPLEYNTPKGAVASRKSFVGCIGDAIFKGRLINFVNATDHFHRPLPGCSKEVRSDFIQGEIPATSLSSIDKETPVTPVIRKPPTTPSRGDVTPSIHSIPTPLPTTPVRKPFRPPTISDNGCSNSYDPTDTSDFSGGYRFGTRNDSRLEVDKLPEKYKHNYDFSITFNTSDSEGGLMFYASDNTHKVYIAVFMNDGMINYHFNSGGKLVKLSLTKKYNDNQWHTVKIMRDKHHNLLSVDKDEISEEANVKAMMMTSPFYYGGLPHASIDIKANLNNYYNPFVGCMKDFKMSDKPVEIVRQVNVLPCDMPMEKGIYFNQSGGFLKVYEKFNVGADLSINLDIKPRSSSGLLVSVHGKRDFFILEIVDNTVVLRVENGKGSFEALFKLSRENALCDGKWHSIQALKSKNVVQVGVDGHFSQATTGNSTKTDTRSALFIGGHPTVGRGVRGARVRTGFFGCIRRLTINKDNSMLKELEVPLSSGHKGVNIGACPTE